VQLAPGSVDMPYHENFELHRTRIDELAAELAKSDMRLGITFQAAADHRSGMANPFIATPEALVAFLKTTSASNLGVVVDIWDWTVGGGTAELLNGLKAEQIVDVRLADLPEGFDAETVTDADRLAPGSTGVIDITSYLRFLADNEYKGPLTPVPAAAQLSGKRDVIVREVAASVDQAIAKLTPPEVEESAAEQEEVGAGTASEG
jgi:sugar phosphate isomerase/epimerase